MTDTQPHTPPVVTERLQPLERCNEIVTALVKLRNEAQISQQFIAVWLCVSRKKLSEFENGSFDFELMCNYADKLSVEIKITFETK